MEPISSVRKIGTKQAPLRSSEVMVKDLLASVVVFLVALPLCMGIAIASGLPPAAGLITGIIGGLLVGVIAGCPLQVSGPAAGLAVFTYQLVQENGIAVLGLIIFAGGVMQLAAGLIKAGQLFRAISPSVIHGMLAGIGVLIFGAQFHVMLDDRPKPSGLLNLSSIPEAIYKGIFPIDGSPHELAAVAGLTTIVVLIVWNKFFLLRFPMVPGALVAVVTATAVAAIAKMPIKFVEVPDSLIGSITWLDWASLPKLLRKDLMIDAFALAFVASAETLLTAAAVDKMQSGKRTNYDRELMAQGVGNMLCGVLGGLPMTGVIVRSAANVNAGALTRWSTVFHGAWLLLLVMVFPQVLRMIPTASLAAVLVYTGYKLVSPKTIREMWKFGPFPMTIYAVTLLTVVVTDLLTGIVAGLVLSLAKLIYTLTHMKVTVKRGHNTKRVDVHLEGAATFVRMPVLADTLDSIELDAETHVHVGALDYIDHACFDLLSQWEKQRTSLGSTVKVEWDELMQLYTERNRFTPPAAMTAPKSVSAA